ncbi:MAG: hypothetical protein AVDCRST_MAG78-553 [uncultured Rubrobacteraceae bacterium]|uniref:Uncharacterized protein n=1 Tax=uncultured Rubrobacteraceae bacterium TaxID=349277 RepID=A0A6J4PEW6_9ACTN|nr:MAG: hypothetical protein AVDCRST_MAG78-553 [uncultured Rubrobacteraceae bacterium]
MLRRKKTLEEKTAALIMEEFSGIVADLQRDHQEYRRRLKLKEQARAALEKAEEDARKLRSARVELKKRFWDAYYRKDEAALSEIAAERGPIERATKKAGKALEKARADFEKADFDEVAESFALKAKANIAEDGIKRRLGSLEEAIEDLLAGLGRDVEETGRALRDEYEEPRFDTDEERNAHVKKTVEILTAVAKTYTPDK